MIRKEVEKLRGYKFTEEELKDIILPAMVSSKENEEKSSVIVSPEDFERFQKGEMTKGELLEIKKAVDKVTELKTKVQ